MRKKGYIIPDEVLLDTGITSFAKVLLAFLINKNYNSGPFEIDYTQPELARALNTNVVTVNVALKNLEKRGYIISRLIKSPETNRYVKIYRINWDGMKENNTII